VLAVAGGTIGIAGATASSRLVRTLLFGVAPQDAVTLVTAVACSSWWSWRPVGCRRDVPHGSTRCERCRSDYGALASAKDRGCGDARCCANWFGDNRNAESAAFGQVESDSGPWSAVGRDMVAGRMRLWSVRSTERRSARELLPIVSHLSADRSGFGCGGLQPAVLAAVERRGVTRHCRGRRRFLSRDDTNPTSLPRARLSPNHDLDVLVESR